MSFLSNIWHMTNRWLWKPLPIIALKAVIPVLIMLPIVIFALFVWLVSGLAAID